MKIRNPEAYARAEQRRQADYDKLVCRIAKRIPTAVSDKFHGKLTGESVNIICMQLADKHTGLFSPGEGKPNRANKHRNQRQPAVRDAIDLAQSAGTVRLSQAADGSYTLTLVQVAPDAELLACDPDHYHDLAVQTAVNRRQQLVWDLT